MDDWTLAQFSKYEGVLEREDGVVVYEHNGVKVTGYIIRSLAREALAARELAESLRKFLGVEEPH